MGSVLVIGRGWIGRKTHAELTRRGIKSELLAHKDAISHVCADRPRERVSHIINCAGVTGFPNVDACEQNRGQTIEGNVVFPMQLSCAAKAWDIHLTHWSSGCIYEGGVHDEHSEPNFDKSVYSASKMASDSVLKSTALVLRIRMPFDGSGDQKNLLVKLKTYAKTGKLWDGLNSISDVDEMVALGVGLAMDQAIGPYNMVNDGPITTREIAGMMGLDADWWSDDEFVARTIAPRSVCQLSSRIRTRSVRVALAAAIEAMK